ncbi:helix-turn-helix transcriptional regulator [Candidatus Accumulibacter vicinus]|uniref:Helix-turn-helix domain protein n=1 Tax=Candidatus Accumulibacter vicinus TaxID=2954382 RepID=A0A084XW15_9PROT|nr:helix-turn-helix transcriptional regulator [Candidatus Accumulibacter vicinus]KFB66659.1 MAG: Helix-turn-helix domain protein [Candidatus Accumulibacter vicinus]
MKIGQVIRKRRRDLKMTLETLAANAGTDAAGLSRVERGLQNSTPNGLAAIAEALGTTVATLFAEVEDSEAGVERTGRPLSDEQELLMDYRRLRGTARSLVKLIVSEMAKN